MAETLLQFDLVAPERLLASEQVEMVVLPGAEGDFGVLPQHAPLVSLLRPGVIAIFEGNQVKDRVFVAGGFAEVSEQGLIVLAEGAEPVGRIDAAEAQQRLRDAEEDLADAKQPSDAERERLEQAVAIARARLEAAQQPVH